MNMGVERAHAQPQSDGDLDTGHEAGLEDSESLHFTFAQPPRRSKGAMILAAVLILAGLAWIAVCAFALATALPADPTGWAGWAATVSAPLILLSLLWLIFGRTSRLETERFTSSVQDMRQESERLEQVLGAVAERLRSNREALSGESARLMSLGDEASDRLGRVTQYLSRESAELDRRAQSLDQAAASARVDIGVLMSDLPRAEEQARALADSLKGAGLAAHEQAAALEGQLSAVTARSREADEQVGGAAQRLAAQVARIDSSTAAAAERIQESAVQMNAAVDAVIARASESIDQTRVGLETQGQAMMAMVEQGRTVFETAGAEASRRLSEDLEQVGSHIERLAVRLAEQQRSSSDLVGSISARIEEIDSQLSALGRNGAEQNGQLAAAVEELRSSIHALRGEIEQGGEASGALAGRAQEIGSSLAWLTSQLRDDLPEALEAVETRAGQARHAAEAAMPAVSAIHEKAVGTTDALGHSEASIARQAQALEQLVAALRDTSQFAEEQLGTLASSMEEADRAAERLSKDSAPQLVEALVRVRETANQAAAHVRDAIAAVIPDSVAVLAAASREAVAEAVTEPVQDQLAEIAGASQRATAVARAASERLTRQLLAIGETAVAIEDRIISEQAKREEKDAENLTRRVSLLIEALNSTAIDVNKILSNEVADTAWAAYLKGDRGVFTRRAVRLLDSGEAREILRHYEEEPDFREQVNRYVHDFETMLRRILRDRDGATLGVTLLSSDMGKLYVALSQVVERLRR